MEKANDTAELTKSIDKSGKFTKDGSHLHIGGDVNFVYRGLTSLVGSPSYVAGDFDCSENAITSLEGAPTYVGGNFDARFNRIVSLAGVHKQIGEIRGIFLCDMVSSSALGLLLIKGVKKSSAVI